MSETVTILIKLLSVIKCMYFQRPIIPEGFLSMAGLIVLLPISLLASGAIVLTLTPNIVHLPLIRLHTEDAIVIYLVICITTVYYAFITSFRQPQSLIDGLVEPPMIPSWVPWVGSGFDYFAHPLTFFKKHRYNFSLTESQNVEVMVEQHTEWICFQIQVLWQDDRGCLLSYCSFQFSQRQVWSI